MMMKKLVWIIILIEISFQDCCLAKNRIRGSFLPNEWYTLEVVSETYLSVHLKPESCEGPPTFVSVSTELMGPTSGVNIQAFLGDSMTSWKIGPDTQNNATSPVMCYDCKSFSHLNLFITSDSNTTQRIRFRASSVWPEFPTDGLPRFLTFDSPHSFVINLTRYPDAEYLSLSVENVVDAYKNVCMMVSIQGPTCPLRTNQNIVSSADSFGSVLEQGTFNIRTSKYSNAGLIFASFFILPDDAKCHETKNNSLVKNILDKRRKQLKYSLRELHSSEYVTPVVSITSTCFLIGLGTAILVWLAASRKSQTVDKEPQNGVDRGAGYSPETLPDPGESERLLTRNNPDAKYDSVSAISKQDSWFRRTRSRAYCYLVPIVLLFYFVPAIQVALNTKGNEEEFGDKDTCFHNFRCSRPMNIYDDFNHIVSNLCYTILGLFFLLIVSLKSRRYKQRAPPGRNDTGTLRQLGMFYALGFGLVGQGFLSSSFHVCPTTITIQFDTSIMYIILTLCTVKICQFRHPDATPSALGIFLFLAMLTLSEAITIYFPHNVVYAVFYLIHLVVTLLLAVDIYFVGCLRVSICEVVKRLDSLSKLPVKLRRLAFALVFAATNVCAQLMLILFLHKETTPTLSVYILAVLGLNLMLYLSFFVVAKQLGSRPRCQPMKLLTLCSLFTLLSIGSGVLALLAFVKKNSNRTLSAAESRNLNEDCVYMNFFDVHDAWHFWSAVSVFFAFVALLDVDEDLAKTQRNQIPLF